jgi:hypothetical protein
VRRRGVVVVITITLSFAVGTAAFIGCGVEVAGTSEGVVDANADSPTPADSGSNSPMDSGVGDETAIDAADDLRSCGDGGACPQGTEACVNGTCLARMSVVVTLDGVSNLVLNTSSAKWHHVQYVPPGTTTINGVAWEPTWPGGPMVNCNCDSFATTFVGPALPPRAQNVTLTKNVGRFEVGVLQPTDLNGYTLTLLYNDDKGGAAPYDVTVVYATR